MTEISNNVLIVQLSICCLMVQSKKLAQGLDLQNEEGEVSDEEESSDSNRKQHNCHSNRRVSYLFLSLHGLVTLCHSLHLSL